MHWKKKRGRRRGGKTRLNRDSDLIVLIHQWLRAIPGFPKRGGDANKDGHCPKEAVSAPGQERAETEERLRKCCVRIVTQNISDTEPRRRRGKETRGGRGGRKRSCRAQANRPRPMKQAWTQFWFHRQVIMTLSTKLNFYNKIREVWRAAEQLYYCLNDTVVMRVLFS